MGWLGGLLAAGFLFLTTYAYAQEPENGSCLECNVILFELRLMPFNATVSFGDMFEKAECEELKAEIEAQMEEPFQELVCVEVWAQREKI